MGILIVMFGIAVVVLILRDRRQKLEKENKAHELRASFYRKIREMIDDPSTRDDDWHEFLPVLIWADHVIASNLRKARLASLVGMAEQHLQNPYRKELRDNL